MQSKTMHISSPRIADKQATFRRQTAFTLLEVMVALVIVAMIAAALFAALTVAFKARKSAVNNLTNLRQMRYAMQVVGGDIQTTLPPVGVLAGAFLSTPDSPSVNFDTLTLFNAAPAGTTLEGTADVQHVELVVMAESDVLAAQVDQDLLDARDQGRRFVPTGDSQGSSDMVLVRRVTRRLLAQTETQPPYQIIARHVQSFRVRLYDGEDWLDTWDSTTVENTLPQAVEVTLEIKEAVAADQPAASGTQPRVYTMTRVFPVLCYSAAVNDAQQAGGQAAQGEGR